MSLVLHFLLSGCSSRLVEVRAVAEETFSISSQIVVETGPTEEVQTARGGEDITLNVATTAWIATSSFLTSLLVSVRGGWVGYSCFTAAHLPTPTEYWLDLLEDTEEVLGGRRLLLLLGGHYLLAPIILVVLILETIIFVAVTTLPLLLQLV